MNNSITVSQFHNYEPGDEIIVKTRINNSLWKLIWHWLLQKPLKRFNEECFIVTKVHGINFDCVPKVKVEQQGEIHI